MFAFKILTISICHTFVDVSIWPYCYFRLLVIVEVIVFAMVDSPDLQFKNTFIVFF